MAKQGTILVVDDNKGILTAVQMLLGTCFEKVITISTPNKIKTTLHNENVDVVLLDMNFSAGKPFRSGCGVAAWRCFRPRTCRFPWR